MVTNVQKREFSSGIVGNENYIRSGHVGIFQEGINWKCQINMRIGKEG